MLAKKVNRQYNENYLQAEYQTARTAAQMAQKWERFQESKHLFPNLKFRTVGDDRVRPDHILLDGIIKPIDSPFWLKYFPPLDWRCRCDVINTAEPETADIDEDKLPSVQFEGNVAIDEEIFTKKGTYFKLLNTNENAVKNVELSKLNAPYQIAYKSKAGKKVLVNIYADAKDLTDNVNAAKVIVENLKINVHIRPHLDTNIAKAHKNAEYFINGNISDLKTNFKDGNYKGINRAFDSAKKQGVNSIVFDFTKSFQNLDIVEVNRFVLSNINEKRGKQYKEIIFIYHDKTINVDRQTILDKKLIGELRKLKANSK